MVRLASRFALVIFVLGLLAGSAVGGFAQKTPTIDVTGPIILAFFVPVTEAQLRQSPETSESLADFQHYVAQVRPALSTRGIELREVRAERFTIRQGAMTTLYAVKKNGVGYCLASPGKEPLVQFGVLTDADLLKLADKYFGKSKN